jgi:dTDP-4-amino-4,6-dideoxygalactose transaminase
MIPVTKPFLPPREEYDALLDGIYERCWLTNNGPLVHELEQALAARLAAPTPLFVANGTVALQLAIKAVRAEGDVVTTAFSYVATTSAIVWEGCTPVFADIEPTTFTIDPDAVDAAITSRTSAIVATHVFGVPCDLEALAALAAARGVALIYDGAHSFATRYRGRSVFSYGDVTTCSFHATKLFHTVEGGGLFTEDGQLREAMARMRNFGHVDYTTFDGVGINAKGSELHAAMGLCNLRHVDAILARRRAIHDRYVEGLAPVIDDRLLTMQGERPGAEVNRCYVAVLLEDAARREVVHDALIARDVHPRRYFSPGLNELDYVKPVSLPVSDDVAARVLCLPTFHDMTDDQVDLVSATVCAALGR